MCEPTTALAVVSIAGTAMSAYGMYQGQQAANIQADYQAQIADNNATAARYEGEYAKEAATKAALEQRQKTAAAIGKQRAAMGATGIVADEGTFLDLTLDTAEQGKLDELAILHEGDMQAWQAEIGANNYTAQGELYRASKASPFMAAAPKLLTGASNTGLNYYAAIK